MEELEHNRIQYSVFLIKTKMNNPEPRGNISLQQAVLLMELNKLLNKRHPHDKLQVNHNTRTVWFINWKLFYLVFQATGSSEILLEYFEVCSPNFSVLSGQKAKDIHADERGKSLSKG